VVYEIDSSFKFKVKSFEIEDFGDINEWAKLCDRVNVVHDEEHGFILSCVVSTTVDVEEESIIDFEKKVNSLFKMLRTIERKEKRKREW